MKPQWNFEAARHLLFRAGFGAKLGEIEQALVQGLDATVDALFQKTSQILPSPSWLDEDKALDLRKVRSLSKEEKEKLLATEREHIRDLVGTWIGSMIATPTPADMLHQRMVFFWHGHFATSAQKVRGTPFIYGQLKMFHEKALGTYADLLHSIVHDPAMLRYLDNDQNRKGAPNENLAREIMELFSLGNGQYHEKDIQEGARALTGWGVRPWDFLFKRHEHDYDEKTIFGKTGKYDGDDFVNLILEKPACSEFMTRKIWSYFGSENPKPELIAELASGFVKSKYDIVALLRRIFTHPEFYSSEVMGSQIKSPIQLIVGTSRTLGMTSSRIELYGRMLQMLGQIPYYPPNVKGWPGGRNWIDTTRLVTRYTFAEIISEGHMPSEMDPRQMGDKGLSEDEMNMSMAAVAIPKIKKEAKFSMEKMGRNLHVAVDASEFTAGLTDPAAIVDRITRVLLPVPPLPEEKAELIKRFEALLKASTTREKAIQALVGRVMLLPSYQLC